MGLNSALINIILVAAILILLVSSQVTESKISGNYEANGKFFAQYGPYGRQGPSTFSFILDQTERIKSFTVSAGDVVDGIGFEIVNQSGTTQSVYYGGHAYQTVSVRLRDGEYITKISGSYGDYTGDGNLANVARVYIHTNVIQNGYGPYGLLQGCGNIKSFSSPYPSGGPIVGFSGATGHFLQSIGVYVATGKQSIKVRTSCYAGLLRTASSTFGITTMGLSSRR